MNEPEKSFSPTPADALPAADELCGLGVMLLKRIFARAKNSLSGKSAPITNVEWVHEKIVLYGLGLPLQDTLRFIFEPTTEFEDLERRALEINGGEIPAKIVERINASLTGAEYSDETKAELAAIDAMPGVLNNDDLDFWHENGYVIVRNAITRDEAATAEQAVWEYLGASPDDRATWYDRGNKQGIWVKAFNLEVSRRIRGSLRVRKAFAQIWGTSDLWPTVDSVGFNPPEIPGRFSFPGPNLHWDRSLTTPLEFGTQGVLYLNSVSENQGAFRCVPGFHRKIEAWLDALPAGFDPREFDLESLGPVPIAANAGDLIIWHQSLPHGSSPNRAEYPRVVQYINMFPNRRDDSDVWK